MGPVDYLVVRFPGNKFSGEIAPELAKLERNGIVRVIDLVFVLKDEKGKLMINEANNLQGKVAEAFKEFAKRASEWFTIDDIEALAAELPDNSSAGILLYENTWAIHFKEALINSGAEVIDQGRIPPEAIKSVEQKLLFQGGI